jgi:hypothetical protein
MKTFLFALLLAACNTPTPVQEDQALSDMAFTVPDLADVDLKGFHDCNPLAVMVGCQTFYPGTCFLCYQGSSPSVCVKPCSTTSPSCPAGETCHSRKGPSGNIIAVEGTSCMLDGYCF